VNLQKSMTKLEDRYHALHEQIVPLNEQIKTLQGQIAALRTEAWKTMDIDFLNSIKAAMLTGPAYVRSLERVSLNLLNPQHDVKHPERVGMVKQVKTSGTKHLGVWVWFREIDPDPMNSRKWLWIPTMDFRNGLRYQALRRDNGEVLIPYPEMPKWARSIR
jgi:hypothetical protein